ncbi:hypothetical protein FALBO_2340 [Fusarium albosuccineum]|uniref:DUF2264 domain-containing protein n=1 Tax=Fusarium albosuccineum TaxID=1237068 RepID=A0A8H4LNN6_9HYPO|nr:hypothetical protein FALBO_2340 [Fusarium albosuccineum]
MPPLPGFSDNAFKTRDDAIRAAEALITPLMQYMSAGKGRVKIPHATGTHFDETAAQLEGFARPFWVIGALLMGRSTNMELLQPWLDGFEAGTDPDSPDFWGPIKSFDQRMVEAEMISFSLLAAPRELLWERLSSKAQRNLISWLSGLHDKDMPQANWLWFRVFANLALLKVCQIDTPVVKRQMQQDLECLDRFYITDGWSGDGLWRSAELDLQEFHVYKETGVANTVLSSRNACYYSGSFAIHFSQLLYINFAGDLDPERTERYKQQARDFGRGFCRFFDEAGAAIPFGRSLTYRFACGGFFAALAVAGVDMPVPLNGPGSVKGFLLRHLRWWARHSDNIFYTGGVLNLGWIYPQFVGIPFKGVMAKYSKFAYSSSFGFSVPVGGHGLAQVAPDSTLAFSRDGMETWAVKYKCAEPEFKTAVINATSLPTATVQWFPWADRSVSVSTTIIPPTTRWPDWHVRIHRIKSNSKYGKLFTAEGGFAIHGRHRKDTLDLRPLDLAQLHAKCAVGEVEGIVRTENSVLILSGQGASGIKTNLLDAPHRTTATPLKPEPNTNLMRQRTLIPTIQHTIDGIDESLEILLVTKVFAISAEANGGWKKQGKSLRDRWLDEPAVDIEGENLQDGFISMSS